MMWVMREFPCPARIVAIKIIPSVAKKTAASPQDVTANDLNELFISPQSDNMHLGFIGAASIASSRPASYRAVPHSGQRSGVARQS
jgi:hypothetical protein